MPPLPVCLVDRGPKWEIPTAQNLQEPVTSVTSGSPTSDLLCQLLTARRGGQAAPHTSASLSLPV